MQRWQTGFTLVPYHDLVKQPYQLQTLQAYSHTCLAREYANRATELRTWASIFSQLVNYRRCSGWSLPTSIYQTRNQGTQWQQCAKHRHTHEPTWRYHLFPKRNVCAPKATWCTRKWATINSNKIKTFRYHQGRNRRANCKLLVYAPAISVGTYPKEMRVMLSSKDLMSGQFTAMSTSNPLSIPSNSRRWSLSSTPTKQHSLIGLLYIGSCCWSLLRLWSFVRGSSRAIRCDGGETTRRMRCLFIWWVPKICIPTASLFVFLPRDTQDRAEALLTERDTFESLTNSLKYREKKTQQWMRLLTMWTS